MNARLFDCYFKYHRDILNINFTKGVFYMSNYNKALAKSIENEHRIDNLTHINYALISLVAAGIFVPLIIYLIEKFM